MIFNARWIISCCSDGGTSGKPLHRPTELTAEFILNRRVTRVAAIPADTRSLIVEKVNRAIGTEYPHTCLLCISDYPSKSGQRGDGKSKQRYTYRPAPTESWKQKWRKCGKYGQHDS